MHRLTCHALSQCPHLGVVDVLGVAVLHPEVPPQRAPVGTVVPHELGGDLQLHPQHRPGDGVQLGLQGEAGEGVHQSPDAVPRRGVAQQGPDLAGAHVLQLVQLHPAVLQLRQQLRRQRVAELAQRVLVAPQPLLKSLAEAQCQLSSGAPPATQADLEHRARNARRIGRHVHHVRSQREAVHARSGHEGLDENADFAMLGLGAPAGVEGAGVPQQPVQLG
mmetsp:Transcript_17116/g.51224  ORF Transcript_17116/g.51224 Transcript_17116/m.51224 type:complete len:220 (+) Transcript_17116:1426-2085(+)